MLKKAAVFILTLILLVSACSPVRQDVRQFAEDSLTQYYINAYYNEREKVLKGYQQIVFYNSDDVILEDIYFHLYPNAFADIKTAPFLPEEFKEAYPLGFEPGFIVVHSVKIEGNEGEWGYTDDSKTVLRVSLPEPIYPGKSVTIDLKYTVKFPWCHGRFGYGHKTVKAANWYPIIAVFDKKGWNLDPYYPIGDPFYSDVSNYLVNITLPEEYIVATTGEIIRKERTGDGCITWTVKGERVRDFAWIASKEYKVKRKRVKEVEVRSYYFNEAGGKKALEVASESIEIFSRIFGVYPYKTYSVAAADFFTGGMEYPNLVFIDKELYNKGSLFSLEYVVAHETAHQWWYGIVGNDEVEEPWLDEGLTEYSTVLYYEERYGPHTAKRIFEEFVENPYNDVRESLQPGSIEILDSLGSYSGWREYFAGAYCGGAVVFDRLRRQLGDEKFFKALRVYYNTYKFQNATTKDLVRVMEDVARVELEDRIGGWLYNSP